uniref:Shugoshin C-terminal domain-containing protein n=1 Tax=Glossina austeni TaxID=7395 RepID=A0A1A9UWJ0_GLOAU
MEYMENYKVINRELVETVQKMRITIGDLQKEICSLRQQLLTNNEEGLILKSRCRYLAIQLLQDVGTSDSEIVQYLKAPEFQEDGLAEISNNLTILEKRHSSEMAAELRRSSALFHHEELLRSVSPIISEHNSDAGENSDEEIDQEMEDIDGKREGEDKETKITSYTIFEEDENEVCECDESDKENSLNATPREESHSQMTLKQLKSTLGKPKRLTLSLEDFRDNPLIMKTTDSMSAECFSFKDGFEAVTRERNPLENESIQEPRNCNSRLNKESDPLKFPCQTTLCESLASIKFNENEFTNSTPCAQRIENSYEQTVSDHAENGTNESGIVRSRPSRKCKPTNLAEPLRITKLRNENAVQKKRDTMNETLVCTRRVALTKIMMSPKMNNEIVARQPNTRGTYNALALPALCTMVMHLQQISKQHVSGINSHYRLLCPLND